MVEREGPVGSVMAATAQPTGASSTSGSRAALREAFEVASRVGQSVNALSALESFGALLAAEGECEEAARLLAGVEIVRESIELRLD
jgi:hypothetical protein